MIRSSRGLSLVELLVTVGVLGVVATALIGAFSGIQRGLQRSKSRTVATALCRELMESLRSQRYPLLRPTKQADLDAGGFDASYYPPELDLRVGGVVFERYNRVTKAAIGSGGQMTALPPAGPDAGLKKIEVWVSWTEEGARRTYTMSSLLDDPARPLPAGSVAGAVFAWPGGPGTELAGVQVVLEQNASRRDVTGLSGSYRLSTSSGTFLVRATKAGYFPAQAVVSATPNAAQDFVLVARGSGTISGFAYLRDHPVISRVVVSTTAGGLEAQLIELYNPTTAALAVSAGTTRLRYASSAAPSDCPDLQLAYVSTAIPPSGFYLIGNAAVVEVDGSTTAADAYFTDAAAWSCVGTPPGWAPPAARRLLQPGQSGSLALYDGSGARLDAAGWTAGGVAPPVCEGACLYTPAGLLAGEQLVRLSTPGAAPGAGAPSFDSGVNAVDLAYAPGPASWLGPRTAASAPLPPATGTPAVGAVVTADDGLSSAVAISSPTGWFELPGVATCAASGAPASWTVQASSRGLLGAVSGLAPASGSATDAGILAVAYPAASAIVTGRVVSSTGAALAGMLVSCAGQTGAVDGGGAFRLVVPAGTGLTVAANPGHADPSYASVQSTAFDAPAGQAVAVGDLTLDAVGRLTGVVTTDGVNPLPGVVVAADAPAGTLRATATTDSAGRFELADLPVSSAMGVGAYSVFPALDASQASAPGSATAVVTPGADIDVGTFTVSRALGAIKGVVSDSGAPISAGVLIVATQVSLGATPPDWDETLRSGSTYYYAVHSASDGTFTLPVRISGAPYNVYAWYSRASGETATVTSLKTATQVVATPAAYTLSFSWP